MKTVKKNKEIILHSLMCSVGGLLAGYAILCRGNLGSAQTLNLIDIMLGIVGRNREEVIFRVFGAVIYILGIESYILIKEKTKINLRRYSVVTDMAGCVLLAFIPPEAEHVVGIMPLFYILSIQWSVFRGTHGHNASTVFSTNNLYQLAHAASYAVMKKSKSELIRTLYYLNTLFWFNANVVLSYFLVERFGMHTSLFAFIYLVPAYIITFFDEKEHDREARVQKEHERIRSSL